MLSFPPFIDGYKKNLPFIVHFVRVKSYEGMESTGKVEITGCDVEKLHNKHVLFVEDIIDTGLTMSSLISHLKESIVPASIRVASLVEKRTEKSCGFKADYVGYSIPDVYDSPLILTHFPSLTFTSFFSALSLSNFLLFLSQLRRWLWS